MSQLRIRQILFVPPAPVVWATHLGAFGQRTLEVETSQTLSSDELGQGLADGRWDIGIGVMDNIIAWNAERKAGLAMMAQLERSTVMSFCATPDCTTLADAAKRPIAVDATTNGFVLVLYRALAQAGIDWRSCTYDAVGGVKHRFDALMAGRAVSTILIPPFDAMAETKGFRVLWRGADIASAYPGQVVAARRQWLAENRDAAVRYLGALVESNRWGASAENRESAIEALVNARYSEAAAERLAREAVTDLRVSLEGWNEVASLRRECGLMPEPAPDASTIIDEAPLVEAIRGK
jgi:ABC-type nitrate/sulfonate/bicarbonate transport system substrate-binding protein